MAGTSQEDAYTVLVKPDVNNVIRPPKERSFGGFCFVGRKMDEFHKKVEASPLPDEKAAVWKIYKAAPTVFHSISANSTKLYLFSCLSH